MKVSIDIDCTPEEARTFFGLPDVEAAQAAMSEAFMEKLKAMDAESMIKAWSPVSGEAMEKFQDMFWSAAGIKPGGKGKS